MKLVAVGLIMNSGRVLTCQRKRDGRYPLKWEFPGGKLENGESAETALVRELREELGIEAVVDRELHKQEWVYPHRDAGSNDGAFKVFYFLIESFAGTVLNRVFEQIRWVRPEELRDVDILEGNRDAVEILIAYARQKQTSEKA